MRSSGRGSCQRRLPAASNSATACKDHPACSGRYRRGAVNDEQLVKLTINGRQRSVRAMPTTTLLTVLRDELALTGAKRGCNQGVCGACTVLVADQPVRSCLSLAVNLVDRPITTVEGLAQTRELAPLQRALIENGAVQCGFCT